MKWAPLFAVLLACSALAHEPEALELEPDETVPVVCDFSNGAVPSGVTCDTPGSATITLRQGTDASPGGIMTVGPAASGADITMTISPGGTRHGNKYQVHTCCTFSNTAVLCCNYPVHVKRVTVR